MAWHWPPGCAWRTAKRRRSKPKTTLFGAAIYREAQQNACRATQERSARHESNKTAVARAREMDVPMLILTRKAGESLHLGDDIKITVFSVQGKQVNLGIDVPEDMTVYRDEVYQRIKDENRQAMQTSDNDLLAVTRLWKTEKK